MTLPNTFGTIATGAQEPGAALDQNFQGLGSSVVVQCTASGTNAITLQEVTNAYQPSAYANYQLFSFVVPNTLTGAATIQYRSLPALPWYKSGATPAAETQLGSGDATQNTLVIAAYRSDLNAGAGGFVTVSETTSFPSPPLIILDDAQAAGSASQTTTASTWNQQKLLNKVVDTGSNVTGFNGTGGTGSNQFALNAGTYLIYAASTSPTTGYAQLRLRDTTGNSTILVGFMNNLGSAFEMPVMLYGQFTATAGHNYEIDLNTQTTSGPLTPSNFGEQVVYNRVQLQRTA